MALFPSFARGKFSSFFCVGLCFSISFLTTKVLLADTSPNLADNSSQISIQINGQPTTVDPPAKLEKGAVLVPLRGVLENLHAVVTYNTDKQQIVVQQGGRTFLLGINLPTATLNQIEIPLSAAPKSENGRAYVPLRSLAELFGYQVRWQGDSKTVVINSVAAIDHMAALNKLGHFGVTIDTTDLNGASDANLLLDAAQKSGASFIKIRFDWAMLEPTEGATFAWDIFDQLVRGATSRGMGVVGVLGDSTKWASIYPDTPDENQWRAAPPAEKYFPAWDNYVRRVVGRYHKDVHAWQIWEYPASYNFRSGAKDYRIIVRRGAVMANLVDSTAVIFAGDPGGVNLGFLHDLQDNGINSITAGVMLHPVSQWQPGVSAQASAFLLPYSTLRENKSEMYWMDALSFPVLSENAPGKKIFYSDDEKLLHRLKSTFTPLAQADYLVKTNALALAAGIGKTTWGTLRDDASYPKVDPVNPDVNSGLLNNSMKSRPAYEAFANLNKLLSAASYAGTLAKGPDAVVLLFSDGTQNTAVAWSLNQTKTTLSLQEVPPAMPTAAAATPVVNTPESATDAEGIILHTSDKSQVLDVTGKVLSSGNRIVLNDSPVWITHLDPAVVAQLQSLSQNPLDDLVYKAAVDFEDGVSADFTEGHETENGIYWKKYADFRGEAQPMKGNESSGLATTISRDIYNPAAGNPSIYLDIDDAYLYDAPGVPVKVTLKLNKPPVTGTDPFRAKGGFNIQYDSPEGFLFTPWKEVEQGTGTVTYTVEIPRAAFTNRDGYDMIINTWGSKQDLTFRSIKVQRIEEAAPVPVKMPPAPPAPSTTSAPSALPHTNPATKPTDVQPAP
jgi:hypothetical protein